MARKLKKRSLRKTTVRRRRRALGSLGQSPAPTPTRSARDRATTADYIQEVLDWKSDTVGFAARRDCGLALNAYSRAKRTLGIVMSRSRSNAEKKSIQDLMRELSLGERAVTLCYQNQPIFLIEALDARTSKVDDRVHGSSGF